MVTRWGALLLVAILVVFVGGVIWAALRQGNPADTPTSAAPTAVVSEALSDGQLDAQIFALGDRNIRLEVQFTPDAAVVEASGSRPIVTFAMADMHMDGIDPPLEPVRPGVWRARFKLPMAGRWIVSVGVGEEFGEVQFDAQ